MIKFPQIPRLFSARTFRFVGMVVAWFCLLSLIAVNLTSRLGMKSSFGDLASTAIATKGNAQVHLALARIFFQNGQVPQAAGEIAVAVASSQNVLGASTDMNQLLNEWQQEPIALTKAYRYWLSVTWEKPDYRDAFIMAAINAYKLGKFPEAKSLINKALALDPNYPPLISLKQTISTVLH